MESEVTSENQNGEDEPDELEKQAMEELLKEAKRGAERARDMGAVGWLKSSIPKTNKRFLNNTVVSTLKHLPSASRKRLEREEWRSVSREHHHSSRYERGQSDSKRKKRKSNSPGTNNKHDEHHPETKIRSSKKAKKKHSHKKSKRKSKKD